MRPTTVVDYEREVFIYEYGNVRVTFDSNVKTSYRDTDFLNPELIMVDALDPDCVILEIKFDEFLPDIIKRLLSIIDTRKNSFFKIPIKQKIRLIAANT
ncbi:VTC domain-containing protein [Peribacillus frigoritolerans]|nr:VTC domain-containing protein [Peribacillus frigoritolerans]